MSKELYKIQIELDFPSFDEAIRRCLEAINQAEPNDIWDQTIRFDSLKFNNNFRRIDYTYIFIYERKNMENLLDLEDIEVPFELLNEQGE